MIKIILKFSLAVTMVILIFGCAAGTRTTRESQALIEPTSGVKIDKAQFGSLSISGNGSIIFSESEYIPLKAGASYGWRIHLITEKDMVTWKEVFILPKPPFIWEHKNDTEISDQGRVAITEKTVSPRNGWIGNGWSVAEGDPPGTYVMKVYVEGALPKTFSFTVQ